LDLHNNSIYFFHHILTISHFPEEKFQISGALELFQFNGFDLRHLIFLDSQPEHVSEGSIQVI